MLEGPPNISELSVLDKDALIIHLFAVVEDLRSRMALLGTGKGVGSEWHVLNRNLLYRKALATLSHHCIQWCGTTPIVESFTMPCWGDKSYR